MSKIEGICRLCGDQNFLHESHIIPSFVYKWLKKTGGPIRLTSEPNRRVQDGLKDRWLCSECEDRLGKREKLFADHIFHQDKFSPGSLRYNDWFGYFATSLAWRTLEYAYGKNPKAEYTPEQLGLALEAKEQWRELLLERRSLPSKFPQHVIRFQPGIRTNSQALPSNWNRFQLRHVTLDIIGSRKTMMTYTKLGPFTFLGMIQHRKREWEGTRINAHGGSFPPPKVILPASMLPLFKEKAELAGSALDHVSERQSRIIKGTMAERLKNYDQDAHMQAYIADFEMFGSEVFVEE